MNLKICVILFLSILSLNPIRAINFNFVGNNVVNVDSTVSLNESELPANSIWLESLDLSQMFTSNRKPSVAGTALGNKPIVLNGVTYLHGILTYTNSFMRINLKRSATRFLSFFNAETGWHGEKFRALVYVDGKLVYESEKDYKFRVPTKPYLISVDLTGASEMMLVVMSEKSFNAKARFGGARIVLNPEAKQLPEALPVTGAVPNSAPVYWLDEANQLFMSSGDIERPGICGTPQGSPISLQGKLYAHGLVLIPRGLLYLNLKAKATRFICEVGINDGSRGSAVFKVFADKKCVFESDMLRAGDSPKLINVDVSGAKELTLFVDNGEKSGNSEAPQPVWAGAHLVLLSPEMKPQDLPEPKMPDQTPMPIARIVDGPEPAIHGPRIVGSSPGCPFFFAIPATGEKPLKYAVSGLPKELTLNPTTGFITGILSTPLKTTCKVTVSNARGKVSRPLAISCSTHGMVPTPPMGWNTFNQWDLDIDDAKIRDAANAMVAKGFADHGYKYVNIDEGWEGSRNIDGTLSSDKTRFPDMKALADYIHAKGLKFGIYSSPGKLCCGKNPGSYDYEQQDATIWAAWGVDYLKYDGCSGNGLPDIQVRWKLMRECLDKTGRDIVYSTNKYRGEGAQLWRTTEDIRNTWKSLSEIGFKLQTGLEKIAGSGRYNDPDMMVVGDPEGAKRAAPLTRNEQITHFSLWTMLASPLILGCDLSKADEFLFSLACNDDVLNINQDPLVRQGYCLRKNPATGISDQGTEIWIRPLFDGTIAVAFFNRGSEPATMQVSWEELGIKGTQPVRDCWMRKDLGFFKDGYKVVVETHAAVLLKVGKAKTNQFLPK